ncbi:zinc finger CCCH domain-containing protein 25-like [Salvia splendens]|uniref:zinc finger CCCH domain-containing protein 25-like n=1 Tax=Salvia splendens TaxID=180675 RepID=UPI0011000506|nr:zinc finger CCCH domain-containing protein 25-like [Salvia splendens]
MTVDDNSSIYVGGLPYDITEDGLRRIFYVYGAVIAVKIINDRTVGGKCYGFVTFANPRSSVQAIREMDGKSIHGRVVKVNDVRSRNGKPHFNRDSRRDSDRSIDGDRGRDHGREDSYDRHRHHDGHRDRSLDHEENRERGHDWTHGHDRMRDHYVDEERFRDYSRHADDVEQDHGRKRERDWDRDGEKNTEQQRNAIHHRSGDKDNEQQHHYPKRSRFDDHGSREISLDSFNDEMDQGENQLAVLSLKLQELRKERSEMEELVAEKQEVVSQLQENYQKLEDSVIAAKKLTSRRHIQLTKLHKCYLHMRDCDDRFKQAEQELQWLVDSTATELGNDGGGVGDGIVTNGRA